MIPGVDGERREEIGSDAFFLSSSFFLKGGGAVSEADYSFICDSLVLVLFK